MTTTYGHFCPVARALEKIGDKWSLLIVRDLLRKPQRFTDLKEYLTHITPKWLTLRLRELEEAGIVQRDRQPGRREVWYRLTPAGRDLAPVMESLAAWGIRHAHAASPSGRSHPSGSADECVYQISHQRRKTYIRQYALVNPFSTGGLQHFLPRRSLVGTQRGRNGPRIDHHDNP